MDPGLWSTLPRELLRLVFARMPLPLLLSVRRSSLEENWDINLDDSEFMRLCAKNHSNLCAVIVQENDYAMYSVGVHSANATSWEKLMLTGRESFNAMCSADGGLVCFALTVESEKKNDCFRLMLVVVNPLTGDYRELPAGHSVPPTHLKMMKLVRDQSTNRYKVLLVGNELGPVREFARFGAVLFYSWTGEWTNLPSNSSEVFLGPTIQNPCKSTVYKLDDCGDYQCLGPCAYECATGDVLYIEHDFSDHEYGDYAISKGHLFLLELYWDGGIVAVYTLSEHQVEVQKDGLSWKMLKEHQFGPVDGISLDGQHDDCWLHLFACKGFLMVAGGYNKLDDPVNYEMALLYDLATGNWLDLQKQGDGPHIGSSSTMLCELQWDAVP